jgi:tRNA threonylcarbamoyladenosine biosynthesis protein TsaB
MRLLALDTATEACSAALLDESAVIGRYAEIGRGHAEEILGMVSTVLGEAGVPLTRVDAIAAGVGPGSFTGVRIGVSVAQGLAFGADLPVVPITSLEALAWRAIGDGPTHEPTPGGLVQALACLDARMGEVYWGSFARHAERGLTLLGELQVGPAAAVRWPGATPFRGVGRGFEVYPELERLPGATLTPEDARALPDARVMARLGALRLGAGGGIDAALLGPQYVRDKVALTEAERLARSDRRRNSTSHGTVTD